MRSRALLQTLALAVAASCLGSPRAAAQAADEPGQPAAEPLSGLFEDATDYLRTLYAFDFDALQDRLTADARFEDPTASALGGATSYRGRDEILRGFRAGAADSRNAGFHVVSHFEVGNRVVLNLMYRTEIRGDAVGVPGAWIPVEVAGVTVLTMTGSRVSEHLDFIDYASMLDQIAEFAPPRP